MKEFIEDYVNSTIKNYYLKFGDFNFNSIKKYFFEDGKVFLDDEVIRRRIEKILKENVNPFK